MNTWDIVATAILGYLSVPLVSFAVKKHWPDQFKFVVAATLSIGFAVGEVWLHHHPLTQKTILAAAWTCFIAQQATWNLHIPGAGTPTVNEALLQIGSGTGGGSNPEQPLEDVPAPPAAPGV